MSRDKLRYFRPVFELIQFRRGEFLAGRFHMELGDYLEAARLVDRAARRLWVLVQENAEADQIQTEREFLATARRKLDDILQNATSDERRAISCHMAEVYRINACRQSLV